MHTSVTMWSKVKVTELLKLWELHFSRSVSSAVLAWSSKLMAGRDSMGPGLQLVGAWFLNFLLGKLSWEFKLCSVLIFHEIQRPYFGNAWCYSHMVGQAASPKYTVCWSDLDPIQGQGQGDGPLDLLTFAHNCTFLGLYPPPLSCGAQNCECFL